MATSNARIAWIMAATAGGMLALAFAADPLYDTFCKVTGFGGTTRVATAAPDQVLDRTIAVRFDANVADAPLTFKALQTELPVRLGEHGLAFYEATNTTNQPVEVVATYNVTPHAAGPYFYKLECFCFEKRVIEAGESVKLPVVFFVDPGLAEAREAKSIQTITLSYTFFTAAGYKGPGSDAKPSAAKPAGAP